MVARELDTKSSLSPIWDVETRSEWQIDVLLGNCTGRKGRI